MLWPMCGCVPVTVKRKAFDGEGIKESAQRALA